jgi:hypothetical protein
MCRRAIPSVGATFRIRVILTNNAYSTYVTGKISVFKKKQKNKKQKNRTEERINKEFTSATTAFLEP